MNHKKYIIPLSLILTLPVFIICLVLLWLILSNPSLILPIPESDLIRPSSARPFTARFQSTPVVTNNHYKSALATIFWVGEEADASNGYIPNHQSAWEASWEENFGGVDDPDDRCGYHPCSFTPRQNPFYFALPYNDLNKNGHRKQSAQAIPWFQSRQHLKSILKNTWIEINYQNSTCYGQWQDVGPFESDDFDYVFGTQLPKNTQGVKAGIDLSPALRDCLGMTTNTVVSWRFVETSQIPDGPWFNIITTNDVDWVPPLSSPTDN